MQSKPCRVLRWEAASTSICWTIAHIKQRFRIEWAKNSGRGTRTYKSDERCYECGERGHFARECREKGRGRDRRRCVFEIHSFLTDLCCVDEVEAAAAAHAVTAGALARPADRDPALLDARAATATVTAA